jgi:hypothetical protein
MTAAAVGSSKDILDRRTERTSQQADTTTRRQTGDAHEVDPPPPPSLRLLDQQQQQIQDNAESQQQPQRCPALHKVIRTRCWERVHDAIQRDPRTVRQCNRHGWSALLLAIYHGAPDWIIQAMLLSQQLSSPTSSTKRTRQRGDGDPPPHSTVNVTDLLSRAVPNGKRLCLHFAARYTDDLHIFQLLVEPYPTALLTRSDDGMVPLDRARFYQKDAAIIDYLQQQMTAEQNRVDLQSYNHILRETVVACCAAAYAMSRTGGGVPTIGPAGSSNRNKKHDDDNDDDDDGTKTNVALVRRLYRHAQERGMPGLFRHTILDYVGVHRLPVTAATATTTAAAAAGITSVNAIPV